MNKLDFDDFLQLQEELPIPETVQNKADTAFNTIYQQAGIEANHSPDITKHTGQIYKIPRKKKRIVFIAAAVLLMGTTIVAAASHIRSKSLSEGLHATDEQLEVLKENEMTVSVGQSVTNNGITVTAIQSITDNYFTHIAFKVDGYEIEPGIQPDFEHVAVNIDGDDSISWSGSFYNGLVSDDSGRAVNADGTPLELDENGGFIENYVMDDGSLEFHITLADSAQKGYFYNKNVHIELENLGTVAKAEYTPGINGNWSFDWNLSGKENVKEYTLDAPLGGTGATVIKAEITPISLYVEYQFPRQEIPEIAIDENGEEMEITTLAEPPQLMGAKMKDGTLYPLLYLGPGSSGYLDETSDRYMNTFAIDRILDEDQVASLLFIKSYPEGEEAFTIENFYEVPLK